MKQLNNFLITMSLIVLALPVMAQRGTGSSTGVARSSVDAEISSVSGTIKEVLIGPCESTTGRSNSGSHIIIHTPDDAELNIHLGPSVEVASIVDDCIPGKNVKCKVFRTPDLPKSNYVAIELETESRYYTLRDSNLRPVWAGRGRNRFRR
jgi:hypothetical protein